MYNHETVTEATIDGKKREVRIVQNKYNCFVPLTERVKNESLSSKKESCESCIMFKDSNEATGFSINDDVSDEKLISMLDYFAATYSIFQNKDKKSWMDIYSSRQPFDYFSSENEDCMEIRMGYNKLIVTLVDISTIDHEKYFTITKLALALFMMMEKFYK